MSTRRIFFPWRPIPVAPIGLGLFSLYGLQVMVAELAMFSPFVAYAFWPRKTDDTRERRPS